MCWRKFEIKSKFDFLCWLGSDSKLYLFLFIFFLLINWRWSDIDFFVRSNLIPLIFLSPFLILFVWIYQRKFFGSTESFWTVTSILTAVLFFMFQNVEQAATKGFLIYAAHQYNCEVATANLELDKVSDKSLNFPLYYFAIDAYLENADLPFGNYGANSGNSLMIAAHRMNGVNSLIATVQGLNVRGFNPDNMRMYNKQIIDITKKIQSSLPCDVGLEPTTLFGFLKYYIKNFSWPFTQ